MAKSQVVNTLANEFGLTREWLNQFQVEDLLEMLNDFRAKFGV